MNIVITDAQTVTGGDISLSPLEEFGQLTVYNLTDFDEIAQRVQGADAVICNKTPLNRQTLRYAENLKYIGLFATGYNNIDIDYCRKKGITVCNAGSYSTDAVAQHTFAFILEHYNKIALYDNFVQSGGWLKSPTFSPFIFPLNELAGKTLGIIGYGNIGKAVARIGTAFSMKILVNSRTFRKTEYGSFVSLQELLNNSDVVTVHCPLNPESQGMFNKKTFSMMKDGAFFINTSRGGVIVEEDLLEALKSGKLSGAAIDVLEQEPMSADCRLLGAPNCIITPHIAWAPIETRKRLMNIVVENLRAFLNGKPINTVT